MATRQEITDEEEASAAIDSLARGMVPYAKLLWRWGDGHGGAVIKKILDVFDASGLKRMKSLDNIPFKGSGFPFIVDLVQSTGSTNAALLLSYILSLGYEDIELTRDEITQNTGLSPNQQRAAEQILKDLSILVVKRRGMPARNTYMVTPAIAAYIKGGLVCHR